MGKTKEYSNEEITVVWKPEVCIHSAKCVGHLPEVFKPKEKPWIQVEHSTTESIIKTVNACPSGALSYYMNAEGMAENKNEITMDNTKIEVIKDGPLMVHGTLIVTHDDGREEDRSRVTAFCRCGHSANKPYCDGSHKN